VTARTATNRGRGVTPHAQQRGLSTVEFAVVGAVVFVVLFGVIEAGRAGFARAMLEEGARRAARLGAVCPVDDPYVAAAARFAEADWGARLLPGVTAAQVAVQYLDVDGVPVNDPIADFTAIGFVRVSISGYALPLFVPFLDLVYRPDAVSSIQPAESFGVSPTEILPCLPST
jgi:Flp pilus assembly protein TadG